MRNRSAFTESIDKAASTRVRPVAANVRLQRVLAPMKLMRRPYSKNGYGDREAVLQGLSILSMRL
ncbi:MAG: hypothetical protein P4L33_14775 [Capsulimonadaceae bacterium]|nr:hypothetical protein [Capsulimonadaceae bacterium]